MPISTTALIQAFNRLDRRTDKKLRKRGDGVYRTAEQWRALRRVSNLYRIYAHRFPGGTLPCNELGLKFARYMCRTMRFDPIDRREGFLDRWAPWLTGTEECSQILSLGPHWYSARSLGEHLELEDEERELLKAWTIEAFDVTPEQRKEINREKDRLRKLARRKQRGAVPLAEYLATHSKSRDKPWLSLGMSRAKFYRLGLHKRETAASPPSLYTNRNDTVVSSTKLDAKGKGWLATFVKHERRRVPSRSGAYRRSEAPGRSGAYRRSQVSPRYRASRLRETGAFVIVSKALH